MKYHENALQIRKTLFGEAPDLYIECSFYNIGNFLMSLGKYSEALKYRKNELQIRKKLYGDTPHQVIAGSFYSI